MEEKRNRPKQKKRKNLAEPASAKISTGKERSPGGGGQLKRREWASRTDLRRAKDTQKKAGR